MRAGGEERRRRGGGEEEEKSDFITPDKDKSPHVRTHLHHQVSLLSPSGVTCTSSSVALTNDAAR